MIEEGAWIVRSSRRLDEVGFGADLNPIRDITRILCHRAKLRENRAYRTKVLLLLFVDDVVFHCLLWLDLVRFRKVSLQIEVRGNERFPHRRRRRERSGSAEFLCVGSAFCGACDGEAWFEVCNPTSLNLNRREKNAEDGKNVGR